MKADGTGQTQLTHFNTPGYPEYKGGRTIVSDSSWSPDGKSLIMTIVYSDSSDDKFNHLELVMVEFE